MKKLFFALASFALISSAHAASDTSDVKFNAEMWFKYYSTKNSNFGGGTGKEAGTDSFWTQRTKMGAHWSKGDDLGAQVTLLAGNVWGNSNVDGTAATPTITGQGYTGNSVNIYEAWAFWKAMDNLVLKVGRGAMDLADGTVVSKNDDLLHPYAFDGVLAAFYTEPAAFNFFGVKGADSSDPEATVAPADQKEVNFYGLSVDLRNLPEALKMVNVMVMEQKAFNVDAGPTIPAAVNSSKMRYAVTVKGDVSGFDYRGTYSGYSGKIKTGVTAIGDIDTKATMFDVEAGYTLKDVMGLRIGALYHQDGGDDNLTDKDSKHYDPFFYDEHNNAGLMDVVKWGNLKYFKVGASVEPMEMVSVGLDYYSFKRAESADYVTINNAKVAGGAGKDKIGTEWDLHASKKLSNGTILGLRYSMFAADDSLVAKAKDASQMYAEAKFTF